MVATRSPAGIPTGGREKCPPIEQLVHYVLGNLDDGTNQTLARHTVDCAACQRTLESLDGMSDTLILRLRNVKSKPRTSPPLAETRVLVTPSDLFPVKPSNPADVESKSADSHQTRDDRSRPGRGRANRANISDEVDVVCDEFEEQSVKGTRPQIEDFLHRVPVGSRETLLIELVVLELDYRKKRGESPLLSEYCARFPRYALDLRELDFGFAKESHDLDFQVQESEDNSDAALRDFRRATEKTLRFEPTPAEKIGEFLLKKKVGAGSYGSVWLAWDDQLQRQVAIKLPRKGDLDSEELKKFVREAQAAAQLKHDHIVAVYQVCSDPLNPYIVSHFIDGVSLKDWLTGKTMAPREAAAFCVKLARALAHAHGRGVIHRDVKPGNIMVDDAGEPHLTDFGLAKRENAEATLNAEGAIMGTPAYMSPEQARGEGTQVTPVTDVYSLGVIFYELLAGKPPFRGKVTVVLKQVINDEPPPPSKAKKGIPRDLETICLKAMSKEEGRRYASAEDFALDLERYLRGEPIQARRTSLAGRALRWVRRNPALAGASVLCCTLGFGLLLFALSPHRPQNSPPSVLANTERVIVETEPAGGIVAITPLNSAHGEPEPQRMIRPAQKTPLEVDLEPGDYLVVANIDAHGFHEVYRHVPSPSERTPYGFSHQYYKRLDDGRLQWNRIKIPRISVTQRMVKISGSKKFFMGSGGVAHYREIPAYYLDQNEFTIADAKRVYPNGIPNLGSPSPGPRTNLPPDEHAYTFVSYDEAMGLAEGEGKRLPEEAEYEFAATNGGSRNYPWGDRFDQSVEKVTVFGPVTSPRFDQLDSEPPVFGLCSNVAEWTRSWLSKTIVQRGDNRNGPPLLEATDDESAVRHRIIRGGNLDVVNGNPEVNSGLRNPRARHHAIRQTWKPGLGFRCARSAKPRMHPEDFITILPFPETPTAKDLKSIRATRTTSSTGDSSSSTQSAAGTRN